MSPQRLKMVEKVEKTIRDLLQSERSALQVCVRGWGVAVGRGGMARWKGEEGRKSINQRGRIAMLILGECSVLPCGVGVGWEGLAYCPVG